MNGIVQFFRIVRVFQKRGAASPTKDRTPAMNSRGESKTDRGLSPRRPHSERIFERGIAGLSQNTVGDSPPLYFDSNRLCLAQRSAPNAVVGGTVPDLFLTHPGYSSQGSDLL